MTESDEALVVSSQRGDRKAFEELVRRTSRLVFARLYLETGDTHRAEDLTQETFLLAFRKIHHVVDPKGFRPWLFSIVHSVVIDAARREGRKKRGGPKLASRRDAQEMDQLPTQSPDPSQAAATSEERQHVLSILRSMPEEYRSPLMLRYIGGADYETIGRELGLTNGSLRGLLHRGLGMLRAQMGRHVTEKSP